MNRHEKRKLESLGSGVYKGKHRGSKAGYHKGCFGSPGIDVPKKETGRGNRDQEAETKVKEYMRIHPGGVTAIELAENVGCSPARAARILDNLSIIGEGNKFLVYEDDDFDPPIYYIGQDDQ